MYTDLLQVGKAYFEMVDYVEADHAFNLARLASPYSLEGMDVYSTVLYVSFQHSWKVYSLNHEHKKALCIAKKLPAVCS